MSDSLLTTWAVTIDSPATMTSVDQRPLKGSRISTFYPVKSLPPISALDSAFQLQEYISLLIRLDIHDVDAISSIPERNSQRDVLGDGFDASADDRDAERDGKSDIAVDEACWIYEQLRSVYFMLVFWVSFNNQRFDRRLAQDLSHPLITMLQQECTRETCHEMKAGEWQYLCVAHGNDGAMEVCVHLAQHCSVYLADAFI